MAKRQGQCLKRHSKEDYPGMDSIVDNIISHFDCLSLYYTPTLRMFIDKIQARIDYYEDRIPEYIDDDWFSRPENIPLSYRLKFLRRIKKNLLKLLEESENDSQDPEAVDSSDEIIGLDDYNPNNL